MSSDLSFYNATPFIPNNKVDLVDTYTAPGSQTTFTLVNNTVATLGSTIQAGNTEYYEYNGGFTTNSASGTFTLATAPVVGTQMVAPGMNQVVISAFDQDNVLGVASPRTQSVPVWLVDPDTINNYRYYQLPSYPGIQVSVVQLISGSTAQTSWVQFASADASGNALSYGATGAPLYLPSLDMFGTITASASSSSSLLYVSQASGSVGGNYTRFWPGQYVNVNVGNSTQEILHVIGVDYTNNILTIDPTGCTYDHFIGESVFATGWKFWMQLTVPLNANNNVAVNLYNLALQRLGAIRARP